MTLGDWTIKLPTRNFTIGDGTHFTIARSPGPKGFVGSSSLRTHDLQLHTTHGDVLGRDVKSGRTLIIPISIEGVGVTDAAKQTDARQKLSTLTQAWRRVLPTDTVTDFLAPAAGRPSVDLVGEIPLVAQLPGQPETTVTYFGRPRDVAEVEWLWTLGRLHVLLTFACSDPWAYGTLETSGLEFAGGPFTLAAATMGHLGTTTGRAWLLVQGWTTAGPADHSPVITNHTDNEQAITFVHTIGTGVTVLLDLRSYTAHLVGTGDVPAYISGASPWFTLIGGVDNSLELALGTDIHVWWLPAYE